jgi:lipopolysaccharide export LptBFGC system permease protein LptF
MSGHGFHVHGPHDHELEHQAQHEPKGFAGQLAVITAILATIGAFFSYMGGATQANAALLKNEAAIKKTEASNQWNYYQSKSSKQNLSELAAELVANEDQKAKYRDKVARYEKEKADIKTKAEGLEEESRHADEESAHQMHLHHRWAQATTALQVSIALAAIALLTKRRWMEGATVVMGVIGIALGGMAWLQL